MNLFRGSEYQRYAEATTREPLTYYDMNLSAQDHQTFFFCEFDIGKPEYERTCLQSLCNSGQWILNRLKRLKMSITLHGNPSQSYGASLAI